MSSFYDSPIESHLGAIKLMINDNYEKQIMRVVQQIGIDIDKEGLVAALDNDRKRYDEAYRKGWNDCKEEFFGDKEKLCEIILSSLRPLLLDALDTSTNEKSKDQDQHQEDFQPKNV